MNRKMIFYVIGLIVEAEAILLLLPAAVSLLYRERCVISFLISSGIAAVVGLALILLCRTENKVIFAKDGFVMVAFAWLGMSLFGALPFTISGEIPNYVDAVFETVSGFTTTGASIVRNVSELSYGILFWRSFTHWVGGMGVLVFVMAFIPTVTDRSMHILRAEMPGPIVGKLVPRARQTAKILYLIYIFMTILEIVLLLCGGMSLYESVVLSFGTAGTGGFSVLPDSIASYNPYLQWVITVFMILFGVNFNLYFLILIKRVKSVLKSQELWCYLGIVLFSGVVICWNIYPLYHRLADVVRLSFFQVATILTTTGYATVDYNVWPELSKGILLCLMFFGGCAGSTAGGLKISRMVLLVKTVRCELKKMIHPRSVSVIQFEGKKLDQSVTTSVLSYFAIFIGGFVVIFLILCLDHFDFTTNFSAVAACINNVGPGLGAVGPAGNFAGYSILSKIVLSIAMLLGRLEIYPILFALSPSTWIRK
ncbi:MAG: TrkH family potassium uptake protein [Clostridia bacterium]|nr:TrkH family potassium uptake protein [Clostridia bacterium]